MNLKVVSSTITFVVISVTINYAQQGGTSGSKLRDAFGAPIPVSNVIDHGDQPLSAKDFWSLIKPSRKLGKAVSPWLNPVTRDYFFGRYQTHEGGVDPIKASEELFTLPHSTGLLGKEVEAARPLVIADDIPFHPIMRRWGNYSSRYYPRRMQDWIVGRLQPAFLLTGKKGYQERIREMLAFMLYTQYQPDGHNQFVKEFYQEDYAAIMQNGKAKHWRGGWDYLFDWKWKDAYGYEWSLHEPDHHVGANMALAMLQGWQMDGDEKYLKSAEEFFTYQTPEYGFHSGVWNGHKYYWTQYGRSGFPKSETSATDNIQALVGRTAAMLGYYKKDPVLLEYARGLLWYMVREFKTDGRWYYDGAENPMNQRRFISHEVVVLNDALTTMAYLLKAGMPVDEFVEPLGRAVIWYRENFIVAEKDFLAWKTFSGDNTVVYVQATTSQLSKLTLVGNPGPTHSTARLIATVKGWEARPASLSDTFQPGDILKFEFAGIDTNAVKISASIFGHGTVTKETRVLQPNILVNAGNFPDFPERVHFPEGYRK